MRRAHLMLLLPVMLVFAGATASIAQTQAAAERDPEFDAAKAALDDGFYDVAAERFEKYVNSTFSKRRKAFGAVYLFNAWHGQGAHDKIIAWLRENWGPVMNGTRYNGAAAYWYARAKYAQGLYDDALRYLRDFDKEYPGDEFAPYALRLRAQTTLALRQLDAAEKLFARYDREYAGRDDIPDNLLDWSEVLVRLNRQAAARQKLERLVEEFPAQPQAFRARLWLGQDDLESGRYEPATNRLVRLATDTNAPAEFRAQAWFSLARAAIERDETTPALNALQEGERLAASEERKIEARIDQARVLMRAGRLRDAVDVMNKTTFTRASSPQAARVQLELADLFRAQAKHEDAAIAYQRYLESFSDPAGVRHALYSMAWSFWALERYGEAADTFERAYDVLHNRMLREQAIVKSADALFMNNQYRAAAATYEKALGEFSDSEQRYQLMYQAAESYARIPEATNAVRWLQTILAGSDVNGNIVKASLRRMARFHEEQRNWDAALDAYQQLLDRYPEGELLAEILVRRGHLKYRLGRFEDARRDFDQVQQLAPESSWSEQAYFMRARCAYQLGDTTNALAEARRYVATYTNSVWIPDVLFWLAEDEFNGQRFAAAETNFAAVARTYPDHWLAAESLYWAGRAAIAQKDYLRALTSHLVPMINGYPAAALLPEARFWQGDALALLEEFAGAILAFEELILRHPDHFLAVRALGRMGDCQFELGRDRPERYREALESYRKLMAHPRVTRELALQAEYKLGVVYERLERPAEASAHYLNVVYDWLAARREGVPVDELWFVRSAFGAAALKENAEAWDEAVAIYRRVVDSGLTAAADANIRIDRIRNQRQKTLTQGNGERTTPRAPRARPE